MSAEILSIVIAAVGLFITLGGGLLAGFAWMVQRLDKQAAGLDQKMDKQAARIDQKLDKQAAGLDQKFDQHSARIDQKFESLRDEIRGEFTALRQDLGGLQEGLGEVKIAVARLEGPRERLILPGGLSHR